MSYVFVTGADNVLISLRKVAIENAAKGMRVHNREERDKESTGY